jgi:nucleoside-diphosphate-sugar epimerase
MKNILIAGSSGMVGSLILQLAIESNEVGSIVLINRKPTAIKHHKIKEYIHSDFLHFESIANAFANIDICYYCIGVYTGQVPTEGFNKITIDYTKAFANALKQYSPQASFCFLSGQGADNKEKSKILFARAKGIAENYLLSKQFKNTFIFRPGYIYPTIARQEPNLAYKLMKVLYKPVSLIYPNIGLTSLQLAIKMFTVGLSGYSKNILENKDIRS